MTDKGRKESMRKVQSLTLKSLSPDKAKRVKGGPMPGHEHELAPFQLRGPSR